MTYADKALYVWLGDTAVSGYGSSNALIKLDVQEYFLPGSGNNVRRNGTILGSFSATARIEIYSSSHLEVLGGTYLCNSI
jgi:hypothetical protein